MFVDGRYTVQVREQVDGKLYRLPVGARRPARPHGSSANAPEGAQYRL